MSNGRYRAYPEYKESGIEWIHSAPHHWRSVPVKYMAIAEGSLFLDGDWIESPDLADEGIRYITTGNVGEGSYKEQGAGFISDAKFKQLNCSEVFPGDILISRLNLPIGRACIVPPHATRIVTSVDNVIFRPDKEFSRQFLVYLFSCQEYFLHTSNLSRGATMQRISRGLLGNIRASIPPLPEQTQIATFLDHETAKIDRLIEKQEELIRLLKEKRQAVISHAVTKGLNPHAPLKDSGIEWLGDVPVGWEVRKVSHLFRAGKGKNGQMLTKEFCGANEGEYPVYSGQTENEGVMGTWDQYEFDFGTGGVLFSTTVGAKAMHLRQLFGRFSLSQNCMIIWPTSTRCVTRFFYFHFQPLFQWQRSMIPDHMQPSFRMEDLYACAMALPPLEDQKTIVAFLDSELAKFDTLTAEAQRAIDLLQERRAALISAAVTGKIDVRHWQPPAGSETGTPPDRGAFA